MDYFGTGVTFLATGYQIWISLFIFVLGFATAMLFQVKNSLGRVILVFTIIICVLVIGIMANSFTELGKEYVNYSEQQNQKNQVVEINLSCTNNSNCSGIIPNNLQISCPEKECLPQTVCPTQTQLPIQTPSKIYYCQWNLALPC
jgi:hypothetical protein